MAERDEAIEIYLNDHWAGAGAGAALAKRLARHNRDTIWSDRLASLANEVESDEHTLQAIRQALGVSGGRIKRAAALGMERFSALKPNGRSFAYSPLSRVVESEAMMAGISGKHRLWASLRAACADDPRLSGFDLAGLEQRAERQLEVLRAFHGAAAKNALSGEGASQFA